MNESGLIQEVRSKPRFEFRSFGQNFEKTAKRMARLSMPVPENLWERHSDEVYVVCRHNNLSAKIRDHKLDIKAMIQVTRGLEQWDAMIKLDFPILTERLLNEFFLLFKVVAPDISQKEISYEAFIKIVQLCPDLQAVHVHKQRFGYMVNQTICETGVILINGARVETISCESTEVEDMIKTIKDLGLDAFENINYIQAIKRVVGMIPQPLIN